MDIQIMVKLWAEKDANGVGDYDCEDNWAGYTKEDLRDNYEMGALKMAKYLLNLWQSTEDFWTAPNGQFEPSHDFYSMSEQQREATIALDEAAKEILEEKK